MNRLAPALVLLLAFALRVVGLNTIPPGWRDDEVIETTVHAQLVLDGHYPLYFIQAEGHEPIYHYLSAGWIALVGSSLFSVRLVSAFFGREPPRSLEQAFDELADAVEANLDIAAILEEIGAA